MGAGNQQERLEPSWIVGFVDGEGCFSVSVFRNHTSRLGWQVFPEFAITQGGKSVETLERIKNYFDCGNVFINRREDNHRENLSRYCVRSVEDLRKVVIPFFRHHPLQTAKRQDFELFVGAVDLIERKAHLTRDGLRQIANISSQMNRKSKSKFLESSEAIRRTPTTR